MVALNFVNRLFNEYSFNLIISEIANYVAEKFNLSCSGDGRIFYSCTEMIPYVEVIVEDSNEKTGISNRNNPTIQDEIKEYILERIYLERESMTIAINDSAQKQKKGINKIAEQGFDELTYLINENDKCDWLLGKDYIREDLINFRNYLSNRYGIKTPISQGSNILTSPTLRWTGGPSTLATLFHDLKFEYLNSNGDSYLSGSIQQIEQFILNNFRDSNGEEFSPSSIDTYLNPTRPDKKASNKKKINIEKSVPGSRKK
ncbi:MAG TPA: hypothetical protein VK787_00085 [Puia sp.]|jgi:hypothetical protein|nr:hypothetical protein [Puia sp.]